MVLAPEDVEEAKRIAAEHGVEVDEPGYQSLGFPIIGVALLLVGAAAAVGAVVYLLDRPKGGFVIDLGKSDPEAMFRRDPDVPYGLVVVIPSDGDTSKVKVEVKEPRGLFGMAMDTVKDIVLGALKEGTATVEKIAEAVKKALGDDVDVSVTT